jgi:aryl-alcohol dehydrogenase-like predicted oxidoreductase
MQTRPYGNTGEQLTIVGFGGILVMNEEPSEARRMVSQAYERGIRYFDVAPSYGNAEERLGPALEPYRKDVFLACKTQKRSAEEAQAELDQSLRNLRTDHFDLYQLHAVTTMEDVDAITGPGGALEVFTRARDEGRARFLGFSAHSEEAALALMERCDFDSVLFPVNWVTWYTGRFGPRVLEAANAKGMASLALKALAKRKWRDDEERTWPKAWYHPVDTYEEAELALRFTLSRGVTAAVTPGHEQFLWWACDAADNYRPLTPEEEQELERRAKALDPIFATV